MLPKKNRIPRKIFDDLLKHGKNVSGGFLQAKFMFYNHHPLPPPEQGGGENNESQFSFVIPKTVSKLAVKRNLLRRRSYSLVSKVIKTLKKPVICAFFFKKGSSRASFEEIQAEIDKILSKIQSTPPRPSLERRGEKI